MGRGADYSRETPDRPPSAWRPTSARTAHTSCTPQGLVWNIQKLGLLGESTTPAASSGGSSRSRRIRHTRNARLRSRATVSGCPPLNSGPMIICACSAGELECPGKLVSSLGTVEHHIARIDLRAFGRSALTADIEVPKSRTAR